MKYTVIFYSLLIPSIASASVCEAAEQKPKTEVPCTVKKTTKPKKTIVVAKPAVTKPAVKVVDKVEAKDPCCDKDGVQTDVNNINVNRFNINVGETSGSRKEAPVRYIERVRIRTEVKKVTVSDPNRLMFLLGLSKTQPYATVDSCCTATAKAKYEPDVGLMYIRDFSSLSLGAAFTLQQSFYVTGGFNF
jgi:hypothetical protein